MKKILLLFLTLFLTNCNSNQWQITESGLIDVFPVNLQKSGKLVYCELSAIVFDGEKIILGNDKDIPGDSNVDRSPIVSINYKNFAEKKIDFIVDSILIKAKKYEDFTTDGEYIFATTGFDRIKNSGEWDDFNTLLCWPIGKPKAIQIINSTKRNGIVSSYTIREKLLNRWSSLLQNRRTCSNSWQ